MWMDLGLTCGMAAKEGETLVARFYLSPCQRCDCFGKEVRYAPKMVLKHSQKGDSDLLRSATIDTPLIG